MDYEKEFNVPTGWINFAIARSGYQGSWARLERGEIALDHDFFAAFEKDLHDADAWVAFRRSRPGKPPQFVPPDSSPPNSRSYEPSPASRALPELDVWTLLNRMLAAATDRDPHIFPAICLLRSDHSLLLGALSNTVPLPPSHPLARVGAGDPQFRVLFDVFIASHEVGMRKPERRIYDLAVQRLDECSRRKSGLGVRAEDILFLDDIGQNCKAAAEAGMQVIKVGLGRTMDAVKDMESALGISLVADKARI